MATMPESWRRYKSVAALVKGECSGYRPGKYVPPHYCCENRVDGPCLLVGSDPEPCQKFEAALLPVAPEAVVIDYLFLCPRSSAGLRRLEELHGGVSERQCPRCGGPLPKRKQLCDSCRRGARRKTKRESQARRRLAAERGPV